MNTRKQRLPVDIPLPEGTPLEGGAVFMKLLTLDALESFWRTHRGQYQFAAQGIGWAEGQTYLNDYEWVFAPTKAALVKAFTRWDEFGITCEWYDWYTETDPFLRPETWFQDQDADRSSEVANGTWTEEDEARYQRLRPDTYRGWWVLKNLPHSWDFSDFLGGGDDSDDIIDPAMPIGDVEIRMQERIFDAWEAGDSFDIEVMTASKVEETIAYWKAERLAGEEYYGIENEARA